jgi:hypothetical protein
MNKISIALSLILGVALSTGSAHATSAFENCIVVRATADARNPQISTERSLHRLHRYIADHLRSPGGGRASGRRQHTA